MFFFPKVGVAAANVAKLSAMATKEKLRQKQKELLELTQRKQELEQELKVLRPVSSTYTASTLLKGVLKQKFDLGFLNIFCKNSLGSLWG